MRYLVVLGFLLMATQTFAQKKVLDHTVYNEWNTLSSSKISNDGKYISYRKKPHQGDGYLYLYNVETKKLDSVHRATNAVFSGDSEYLAFKIKPGYDTLRNCELEKVDKKKWPKDSLGIYFLKSDSLVKFEKIKSFKLNDESGIGAFLFDHNEKESKKKKKCRLKKKKSKESKSDGKQLQVLSAGSFTKISDVKQFTISEKGQYLAYTTHQKIDCDSVKLNIFNVTQNSTQTVGGYTDVAKMRFSEQEDVLVFLSTSDTSETKNYRLNTVTSNEGVLSSVGRAVSSVLPKGDTVSINYQPFFSKDGTKLFYGVSEVQVKEPEDTLIKSEKVKLDLWHYGDKRLQPKQLLEVKRDEKKTDLYVCDIVSMKVVQLGNDTLHVRAMSNLKGDYLVGSSRQRYMGSDNWSMPWPSDYYLISISTGETKLIAEASGFGIDLAPSGSHFVTFDRKDQQFYSRHFDSEDQYTERCLSCLEKDAIWTRDINGMPMEASPYGVIGWDKSEDKVYLQSRYDIWEFDFKSNKLSSLTGDLGVDSKIRLRPKEWSTDSVYIDFENTYVEGFNEKTKGTHFYKLEDHSGHVDLLETGYFDARVYGMMRSKNGQQYVLRKMTFEDYPELYTHKGDLDILTKISTTNPQQSEYNWGSVELVNWKSYDGVELEGLVYKPEDYDPSKSYPLMVYFYELYSDRYHQHYIPKPTASIIYATEYASAGYVVFMPDIRYKPGYPAKSAYDCIMSGTDHVLKTVPNVDSTRMALQGQSWGGYQTAQLVTMTTRYRAAMAGAPVSNMFSAYGGIRWGSGLNRQFQYEKTQSRIGATIWEKPELYVENSPIFHIPNIETPLMIMHNDGDGAVPWYQGIEMFTAMKRLGKKAWLLNYNGDKHNLMENANRMDLSIRMRQFFDHYLHDKPAPEWLTHGIPATKKGKELRYEQIEK